jgi:prevent-host-death family protein
MLQITATDLKSNLGRYLELVSHEEIHITKNGVDIAVLTAPKQRASVIDELRGVIPDDGITAKKAREERISGYESDI